MFIVGVVEVDEVGEETHSTRRTIAVIHLKCTLALFFQSAQNNHHAATNKHLPSFVSTPASVPSRQSHSPLIILIHSSLYAYSSSASICSAAA